MRDPLPGQRSGAMDREYAPRLHSPSGPTRFVSMPDDIPEIPRGLLRAQRPRDAGAPTEAAPAAPAAAVARRRGSEPSVADTARPLAEHFPALFGAWRDQTDRCASRPAIHQRAGSLHQEGARSSCSATPPGPPTCAPGRGRDTHHRPRRPARRRNCRRTPRCWAAVELRWRRAVVEAKKHAGREAAGFAPAPEAPRLSQQAEVSGRFTESDRRAATLGGARSVQPGTSDHPDRSPRPPQPVRPVPRRSRPPHTRRTTGHWPPDDAGSEHHGARTKPRPRRRLGVHMNKARERAGRAADTRTGCRGRARHQRIALRSSEQSPLSKANFRGRG